MQRDAPAFDLVIMDFHMPVMDGLAATKEIRARLRGRAHVPYITGLTAGNNRRNSKLETLPTNS